MLAENRGRGQGGAANFICIYTLGEKMEQWLDASATIIQNAYCMARLLDVYFIYFTNELNINEVYNAMKVLVDNKQPPGTTPFFTLALHSRFQFAFCAPYYRV